MYIKNMNNTSILSPIQITSILINNVCTNVPSESHWWFSVHCLPCTSKAAGSDAIKAASWSQFSEWLDSGDFILGVCVLGSRKVEGVGGVADRMLSVPMTSDTSDIPTDFGLHLRSGTAGSSSFRWMSINHTARLRTESYCPYCPLVSWKEDTSIWIYVEYIINNII